MKKLNLDQEEKEILESYERGEWKPIRNQKLEIEKHKNYAIKSLRGKLKIDDNLDEIRRLEMNELRNLDG